MPAYIDGNHLNRYVAPQILREIQNTEDTFTGFFGKVNKSAVGTSGVSLDKLINDIVVTTGVSKSDILVPRELEGSKAIIPWDNFTTETLTFNQEELRAIAFDKKGEGRKILMEAVKEAMLVKALHTIAPSVTGNKTPVVETTGENDGSGRKAFSPKDITKVLRDTKEMKNPVLVLSRGHLLDIQDNETTAKRFSEVLINQRDMKPIPYAGVRMVATDAEIRYDDATLTKKPIGSVDAPTDRFASVFIDKSNTIHYLNNVMFTMTKMEEDTRNAIPRTEIRIFGNFISAVLEDDKKRAAIIDGRV